LFKGEAMNLREALQIKPGEVVSLVGGGGKTTLMFALARELAADGLAVITTTTTRIREPSPSQTPCLLLEKDEGKLLTMLSANLERYRHVTVASELLPAGKLKGIPPETVTRLSELSKIACILVEADGAAQRPLKAPNPTEPVFPPCTSLVVPVVGIDALGTHLTSENVHRAEIASRLLNLPIGDYITIDSIARLITHPQGISRGSPAGARIVPFLNKVDISGGVVKGWELANAILKIGHPQIKRVVLGHVRLPQPVVEVISRE
jgi:probable selenium-dependent hydroxylase accessory protein YqeC